MSPTVFTTDSDFITSDNRRDRVSNPVSAEQMNKKHQLLLPEELVRGKSVLDLGSCIGATGHWCLSLGATAYTGVELQQEYCAIARELLERHHPGKATIHEAPVERWLAENEARFDVVAALGVIYVFTDYYSVLSRIAKSANETVAIESYWHEIGRLGADFRGVVFRNNQSINLAEENSSLFGRGSRISPDGLAWLMQEFGFESSGVLGERPKADARGEDGKPARLPRYQMRFTRTSAGLQSLSSDLEGARAGTRIPWDKGG